MTATTEIQNTDTQNAGTNAIARLVTRVAAPAPANVAEIADAALRVAVGLALVPHGLQKLFGMMGGYGLTATGEFFETQLGFANGYLAALAAGSIEVFGGLALALGLATRTVALMIAAFLLVAASIHIGAGYFWTEGGWQFPALWAIAAAVFAVKGGGRYSIDALIARR